VPHKGGHYGSCLSPRWLFLDLTIGSLEDLAKFFYSKSAVVGPYTVADATRYLFLYQFGEDDIYQIKPNYLSIYPPFLSQIHSICLEIEAINQTVSQIFKCPTHFIIDPENSFLCLLSHLSIHSQIKASWDGLLSCLRMAAIHLEIVFQEGQYAEIYELNARVHS
jgi:hypothetical protein